MGSLDWNNPKSSILLYSNRLQYFLKAKDVFLEIKKILRHRENRNEIDQGHLGLFVRE